MCSCSSAASSVSTSLSCCSSVSYRGAVIALATGATGQTGILAVKALLENMGSGAAGMFETSMVAILVSAICALIREYGGFEALLGWIKKAFRGKRGGQIGMGLLVGAMDIATANNTVAIVMANPIAKEMSEEYGITPRKAASLLDTFSCIFQGIIPYGAQMLVAISAGARAGLRHLGVRHHPKPLLPLSSGGELILLHCDRQQKESVTDG